MTHILTRKRGKCTVITYAVDLSRKLFVYDGIAADINYSIIDASKTVECQVEDLLLCWQYKNDLGKYFMQYVQNILIIHLTNSLKNNICQK